MSSLFSSSIPTISSAPSVMITKDEFNAFHKIDRTLFSRLVLVLNRDMYQSMQVFAFLYFMEQAGYARDLIAYLVSLPDAFVDAVANEVVVCLNTLHNQCFSSTFFDNDRNVIPLVLRLAGGRVTLRSLHQNRDNFLRGIRQHMNDICFRGFEDICARAQMNNKERILALEREKLIEEVKKIRLSVQQETNARLSVQQETNARLSVHQETNARLSVQQETNARLSVQQETNARLSVQQERARTLPAVVEEANKTVAATKDTEVAAEKEAAEEEEVEADDRTVFLTFSKGYPISEAEVRAYFTRRFGEVIEAVEMQEVEETEQPLFARMVLKADCAWKLEEITSERNRNKFTIDGKHVWARKYVRKSPPSAAAAAASPSNV